MSHQKVHFSDLVDWLDNRLDAEERQQVEAHLATCPACQRDLAWLQRVIRAARADDMVEPPPEVVARVKALFRARKTQLAQQKMRWTWMPRLAFVLALTLLLFVSTAVYLSQVPTLFAREATVSMAEGSVQVRHLGVGEWQDIRPGETLREGDEVRTADGVAVFALFEGSQLEMQSGGELSLSTLRSDLFGTTYQIVVQQAAGVVDYDVAPLRNPLCRFEAHAPTVHVAVRGTRFVITVQSQEQTQVTVLQGSVEVANAITKTVLAEREVAIVPADAPLIYLPTLTPLPTLEPAVSKTPPPPLQTVLGLPTPSATATPTSIAQMPKQQGSHLRVTPFSTTVQPIPSQTPALTVSLTLTPTPSLKANQVPFHGTIEHLPPRLLGFWTIDGRTILVTPRTQISGTPEVGRQVRGIALAIAGQPFIALQMEIEEPQPAETSPPSPTPGFGPHPVRTPWPTLTMGPHGWPSPMITPPAPHTPLPITTLLPRRTPHWMPTPPSIPLPQPTVSPEATATPFAGEWVEMTPYATEWAEATTTPQPTWPMNSGPQPRR